MSISMYNISARAPAVQERAVEAVHADAPVLVIITRMSCAIYTHTPARKSSTNFQLYYFVIQFCSTNWLGHGHGYKWHSSY